MNLRAEAFVISTVLCLVLLQSATGEFYTQIESIHIYPRIVGNVILSPYTVQRIVSTECSCFFSIISLRTCLRSLKASLRKEMVTSVLTDRARE